MFDMFLLTIDVVYESIAIQVHFINNVIIYNYSIKKYLCIQAVTIKININL